MLRIEDMYLTDFEGTLMHKDTPLAYFKIQNKRLVEYRRIRKEKTLYPPEMAELNGEPVTYAKINTFFRERVILDGSQPCREFLNDLGLDHYDFTKIVNLMHGRNNIDFWWVANEEYHPTWKQITDKRKGAMIVRTVDVEYPTTWWKKDKKVKKK